jgi:hypothetical protein
MKRVLQEGFDLACVSVMDANGDLSAAITDKDFGGPSNDDWPLAAEGDRLPLKLRGWKIASALPSAHGDPGTYATNAGSWTRGETFLQLDNYYFHGSDGGNTEGPLPINFSNDLTSHGLSTKFETTGDIQSSLKFLYDANVYLEKDIKTTWGGDVFLGHAPNNDVEWNALYLNFCLRVTSGATAASNVFTVGLGQDFGFLVVPLNGTEMKFFKQGVGFVDTGVSISQEGFGTFHQFVIKYLVDQDPQSNGYGFMQIEVWVNGIKRMGNVQLPAIDISSMGPLQATKMSFGKFCSEDVTVHLDDVVVEVDNVAEVISDDYSTKDKFIISLPSVPKRTIQTYQQNLVFRDYHDISIMKPISDAFGASSDYVGGTFQVKDKTAVIIVKGNGSLDQMRQAHGDWDENDQLAADQVDASIAQGASEKWVTAPVVDISSGYQSYVRHQGGVDHASFLNKAAELYGPNASNGTNSDEDNRSEAMVISYALMGAGTHGIDLSLIKEIDPPDPDGGIIDANPDNAAQNFGMPMAGT